ncbi:hypothetical protein [Kribbella sp. CA-293567]|uniref:hypothetical protein n=1 Tax=Kribbella sp. CA-293567 TaxID=3002436 RepID=UPI0022DDEC4D|nr:hypothetical protein [Kribbella sp. CA-293567]WBQ02275.1 hypothetical protein OX958_20030 [Kribbella sp. CA-293567]
MGSPVVRVYTARFSGLSTVEALDRLREVSGLTARGRLDDDRSEEFGVRRLRDTPGTPVMLRLYREDGRWSFVLTYQGDPPARELLESVRTGVRDAVAAAGAVLDEEL